MIQSDEEAKTINKRWGGVVLNRPNLSLFYWNCQSFVKKASVTPRPITLISSTPIITPLFSHLIIAPISHITLITPTTPNIPIAPITPISLITPGSPISPTSPIAPIIPTSLITLIPPGALNQKIAVAGFATAIVFRSLSPYGFGFGALGAVGFSTS